MMKRPFGSFVLLLSLSTRFGLSDSSPLLRSYAKEKDFVHGGALHGTDDDDIRNNKTAQTRQLLMEDFVPLSCNSNLDLAPCVSWTSIFGSEVQFENRVIVNCGICIHMDKNELVLLQGLDIRGKIVVPENHTLALQTSSLTVQGELEIQSTSPVNGTSWIRVVMIGNQAQSFEPVGDNAGKCDGDCNVDRNAFTVAGGKVNVHGIHPDAPTWLRLYDVAGGSPDHPTSIIVDATVQGHWLPGAMLLITSHTRVWNDHQVRTITAVSSASTSGYVHLELNETIRRPMTLVQDGYFAVEVALLSRNVVFEGNTNLQEGGGHFWIMHTPNVVQTIVGIDIVGFGIAGTLGRYPIHFHYCGDSESVVAKNTIRQSHQRCVVVHGTNNVLVQDNVAYDTAGHCFVTEDGIETFNSFIRNLGAQTRAPTSLIESGENEPATFWLTNPTNTMQGNVAAGSVGSGIWYELRKQGPLANAFPDPMYQPFILFENNVVHSNLGKFAIRLYPTGFLPNGNTQIASGLKSYRNAGVGIFIHKVHKFELTGAVFADNDFSVDLERAESINVTNTTIIGMSNSYQALMGREENTEKICNSVRNKVIGIDLHSWRLRNVEGGFDIRDVEIIGFDGLDCGMVAPIHMDILSLKQGGFEVPTSFSGMNVTEGGVIDFCDAQNWGIDFFLSDLDGTLAPPSNPTAGPGVLVSDGPKMTTFIDPTSCVEIPDGCYQNCRDTCLQSINFEVNTAESEDYSLKVCQRSNPARCIEVSGSQRYNGNNPYGDYPRSFFVHLPPGDYDAVFLDAFGAETLPAYVHRLDEGLQCEGSPLDVAVIVPSTAPGYCSELIKNGNAEESASVPSYWLTANGGMEVVQGAGVGGTNALAGTRFGFGSKILQYLDTRCLTEGAEFSVTARVKLLTEAEEISICDPVTERCPYLRWHVDGIGNRMIAEAQSGADSEGFQIIEGIIRVDATVAASNLVYLFVDWIEQSTIVKRKIFVDNVSASAVATANPSTSPSASPTSPPSDGPSAFPSRAPSDLPTATPSTFPSASPTKVPSAGPNAVPSEAPSAVPSVEPSISTTVSPTLIPSADLGTAPSFVPSATSSAEPSLAPTAAPSSSPSDSEPCDVEYVIWNANTNLPVGTLQNQFCLPDFKVNIQVLTTDSCPVAKSALMTLDGPITNSRVENAEPFTLFGDKHKTFHDIYGKTLLIGQYMIRSDLYESKKLNGNLCVRGSKPFEVIEC